MGSAPTTMEAFVGWLRKNAPWHKGNDWKILNIQGGKGIGDGWERPVVLVSKGDMLVAVGSRGQDGIWDNGSNDDIVVFIERR